MYKLAAAIACVIASPACAAGARDTLANAVFQMTGRDDALAQLKKLHASADAAIASNPGNRDAKMIRAMVIGYEAKLTRSRTGAVEARSAFEALAASDPRDPEAQAAVGSWHLDAVAALGGFLARTMLGANKATGFAALDRSVALGGNRAMFPALAALFRIQLDPRDARGMALADAATRGTAASQLDGTLQRSAGAVLARLRAGDFTGAQTLARTLLPLGRISH